MDYTTPKPWDLNWSRPYSNYEKHHQFFWQKIREKAKGKILDIGCGSASCWKGTSVDLHGIDFSSSAIQEALKNYPDGHYLIDSFPSNFFRGGEFDTIVLSGVVNYYQDLSGLLRMVSEASKKGSLILITINVLKDFPDRQWGLLRIQEEFGFLGEVKAEFTEKIGWFIEIVIG